jgi:LPXTG-motif cell wall-anchored protein
MGAAILSVFAAGAQAANSTVTLGVPGVTDTVAGIQAALDAAITAASSGETVTVTGVFSGAASQISLKAPSGVTILWQADYSGSMDGNTILVSISELAGTLEITGSITNTGGGIAIQGGSASASNVVVSGGTVTSQGHALNAGSITMNGGTVSSSAGSALSGGTITVNGGNVTSSSTYEVIHTLNGSVTVSDGAVSALGGGDAIKIDSGGSVTVDGGTVSSTSGSAIECNGTVIVSGGTVSTTTGDPAIFIQSSTSSLTVSGGVVESTGGKAIQTFGGSITVSGGAVSSTTNTAILTSAGNVLVSGGTVSSSTGDAINTGSGNVTLNGGVVSSFSSSGYAINTSGGAVSVTDGFVFAYGTSVSDVVSAPGSVSVSSPGAVVAWDQGAGTTAYTEGDASDLTVEPSGAATWHYDGTDSGILSASGEFLTVPGVTVTSPLTYTISATALTSFGFLPISYIQPAAQTVTVTNTGSGSVTLTQPTATNYDIGALSTNTLAANGGTATFTVRPKGGLAVGNHDETITVSGSNGASATVSASFTVNKTTPTLSLSASPTGSQTYPGNVTLTATLSGAASLDGHAITFTGTNGISETAQTDASGVATTTLTSPAAGAYTFNASFVGDGNNDSATAASISGYTINALSLSSSASIPTTGNGALAALGLLLAGLAAVGLRRRRC